MSAAIARRGPWLAWAGVALALPACLGKDTPDGPGLRVEVAPLELDHIVDATYTITVKNHDGQIVWSEGPLASSQFGDHKGALTYVGPCDASPGENPHTVELVLDSLTSDGGLLHSPRDYVNPTIAANGTLTPIVVSAVCKENGDTPVEFDLTILRRAQQGFFDVAVEFEDIFCSAKLDCAPSFMLRPDGTRGPSVTLGFACTGGHGDSTYMYTSDLVLSCPAAAGSGDADIREVIPMSGASAGNHPGIAPGVFAWALYSGREFPAQSDLEKCYRDVSIGIDPAALAGRECTLSAVASASQAPLEHAAAPATGYRLPAEHGAYPYIRWSAEVLSASGELCTNYALDDVAHPGVATQYVRSTAESVALEPLTESMTCGALSCTGAATNGGISAGPRDHGFTVTAGDGSIATADFALPDGYTLADSCCTAGCCAGPKTLTCQAEGDFGAITATGNGVGFELAASAGDVSATDFRLPAGYWLGSQCCTQGCCQGSVACTATSSVGDVSVRVRASGFGLSTANGGVTPATFHLPKGYSLAHECGTNACCRDRDSE